MKSTINLYNNSLSLDNYFFNNNTNFNNNIKSNHTSNNLIKNNNNFINNDLNFKIIDNSIYNNYFSTFSYNKHLSFNKLYLPKPFNASHSNIYNGLPWFLDYVHLSFWFFFLSTIISILFIVYFFNFIWNNQENKYPIRETRGFSRAQTGDTMTAIIPMTWSVTMLLHASTHSNNFDENVTGTQFCLTVIAYQWGWNYYYPKDIIDIFNKTPIKVGHGSIDYYSTFDDYYKKLLDISRNQLLNKNFLLGTGSSKIGKNNIQTFQSLFFKSYAYKGNLEIPSILFFNINNKKNNFKLDLLDSEIKKYIQKIEEASLNYMYNDNDCLFTNFININNLNNINQNFYFYLLNSKFNILNFYKNLRYRFFFKNLELNNFFYKSIDFVEILNKSSLSNILNKKFFNSNNILKYKSIDSHRNKNTFFFNSNKFYLTYKNILNEYKKPLDKNFINLMEEIKDRQDSLNYIKRRLNDKEMTQQYLINRITSFEEFDFFILRHVYSFNISINQWIIDNDYIFNFSNKNNTSNDNYSDNHYFWLNNLNCNILNFDFKSLLYYSKNKNLNYNDFYQNIYFLLNNNSNIFNFKKIFQSFLYLSEDNSYNFYNNSLLTFEDFGFINTSTIKELLYKNTVYSNFYMFNILDFFKTYNIIFFFNNKFLFNKNNNLINYKFWEYDSNLFLIQNNIFNNNIFNNNNEFSLENNFIYFWPSFILNLLKNFKHFSISNNSIFNISNYNYYSIRNNFITPNLLSYRKSWSLFFYQLFNRNKYQDVYFCDFENNVFNFKKIYSIHNKSKLKNDKIAKLNIFKLATLNYVIFNKIYYCSINNSLFNKNLKSLTQKYTNNNLLLFNNKLSFTFSNFLNVLNTQRILNIKILTNNLILNFNNKNVFKRLNILLNSNTLSLNKDNLLFWDIFFSKNFNNSILYLDKPIRVSLKFNDPYDFNFKLNNDISSILYVNKYLLSWQLNWSDYVKNFSLPSYKLFRGSVDKKNFSSFLNTKNINNSFDNDLKFQNYKLPILKNRDGSYKKDFSYWKNSNIYKKYNKQTVSYQNFIDFEKFNFFKNYIVYLPNVNDDIDINFLLKYLTFDINTSRRNDHNTKFKVFWGPLFIKYINKLSYSDQINNNLFNSLNIKNINFFKSFNLNLLKFDSFYLQNISFQKNYFLINLKIINKNSFLKINFLKNNFFWNFNILYNNSLLEIKNLKILLNDGYCDNLLSFTWFFYENNYFKYFIFNNNFINYWTFFWFFKDNLQNFSNKIFFNKNFKDNLNMINKIYLITSFKDKEFKSLSLKNNNKNYIFDNNLLINDFNSIFSLYQNFFDIKKNTIFNNNFELLLFSDLNLFKYLNYQNTINNVLFNNVKSLYYDYYLLQLQKSDKYRFNFKEINNNISNIKRLRVSKGICLPSDFNIHIICASKDVIHSWAIPGLGIKIDCIPGFNSHRKVLFRWRGLYWGQCMEVCGRYHHWMPILVRIVHKDLFLSWCLSFLRALQNKNFKYEKYYFDEILLLNFLSDSSNSDILDNFFNTIKDKNNADLLLSFIESSILY